MDKEMLHEVDPYTEQIAYNYKDIYETCMQSQRTSHVGDKPPERRRWTEDVNGEKMALICQKFMEAKRMSTDDRLRQSKEFDDALEVLSSNSDLLIRLLGSQNFYQLLSTPTTRTKCTVPKPSNKNHGYSPFSQRDDGFPVQSTRIVVLKPSSRNTNEIKPSSSRNLQSGNFFQGPEDDYVLESRKVAEESKQEMHENMRSHQRDESLHSSFFSNGHSTCDENSFNKTDHEYTAGNFGDLEVMSPLPRHSCDFINCCGSPYSSSSFSHAPSCCPESSVCREAKKRLSERWAMMASNEGPKEQRHVRSYTLGEMLSFSYVKKYVTSEVEGTNEDKEPRESVSCSRSFNEEMRMDGSPKNLPRSNSVPVSSTAYEAGLRVEVCDQDAGKAHSSKELKTSRSTKSSFKRKVSSFLFSSNKKSTEEKSKLSQSKDESQHTVTETSVSLVNSSGVLRNDVSQSFNSGFFEECSLPALYESSGITSSDSVSNGQQQAIISLEPGLAVSKPMVAGISSENQDEPSPISVLEPTFEEGSRVPMKSLLIDKSPPIESVARTLSWDDSFAEVANSYRLKTMMVSLDTKVEEQHWLLFVNKLLSAAALDDEVLTDSFYSRWHSLESPLEPSLRDQYATLNDKEPREAERRHMRSTQKLVFDSVNIALMEITGCGSDKYFMGSGSYSWLPVPEGGPTLLVDLIMAQMREAIAGGIRCVWGNCGGDSNCPVVKNVVRREVVGKGWVELMGLEIDILGREIEEKLIEELVEKAVVDFIGRA